MGLFVSYFGTEDAVQDNIELYFSAKFFQVYFKDNPNTWGAGNDWVDYKIGTEIC